MKKTVARVGTRLRPVVRPKGTYIRKHGRMTLVYRALRDSRGRHRGQVVGVVDGKDTFAISQGGATFQTCRHLVEIITDSYNRWSNDTGERTVAREEKP